MQEKINVEWLHMSDRIWDLFVEALRVFFMPAVCSYFAITAHPFLNMAIRDADGLEWVGNQLLAPTHYLLAGKEAMQKPDGSWEFVQKYDYDHDFWVRTVSSLFVLPPSLILGSAVKGAALLSETSRTRHTSLVEALRSTQANSHREEYRKMGLRVDETAPPFVSQGHLRRPGDEEVLQSEKKALRAITKILTDAEIPWWVDCGTCLGAYRYGGVIPWDEDIDVAVLLPDFYNVKRALNQLKPSEYIVQDWSSRSHPDSYIKVYIKESGTMIDVYFFDIVPEKKELRYILSLEHHLFFPEWWKIRERRFKAPVAFDTVFPLRKADLDGVEVFVPNDPKKYLQRCYGENLDPAKIYDPSTCRYERDLSHPYWQNAYVH